MAVNNLTNTQWTLNSTLNFTNDFSYNIEFTLLSGTTYNLFQYSSGSMPPRPPIMGSGLGYGDGVMMTGVLVYSLSNGWVDPLYRDIIILGGGAATDANLISWLEANATQIVPSIEGVIVTYNGEVIKQSDTDCSFSLSCANKLMTSDITIETIDVGSIVVTYNNDTIIDSSGTHTYQLPCNGKMADTDIAITVSNTNTYTLTQSLTNLSHGNMTIVLTPLTGYSLPSSSSGFTITNGTIVSYSSATGALVVNGNDNTTISCTCTKT